MLQREAAALEEFWCLYRAGKFLQAHEVLEDVWRESHGAQRQRLHGLIHGAVACYQHARGKPEGAARQLARARRRLSPSDAAFLQEIELAIAPALMSLTSDARERLQRLEKQLAEQRSTVENGGTLED